MPTNQSRENWEFFVTEKNMFSEAETFQQHGISVPAVRESLLEALINSIEQSIDANEIDTLTEWYLDSIAYIDPIVKDQAVLDHQLHHLASSRRRANEILLNLMNEKKALDAKIKLYEDVEDTLTKTIISAMQHFELKDQHIPELQITLKLTNGRGKYVPQHDPDPNDPAFKSYEAFVRNKYTWDLIGIKAALGEGVIDKRWLDDHGIEFVRAVSLKEYKENLDG